MQHLKMQNFQHFYPMQILRRRVLYFSLKGLLLIFCCIRLFRKDGIIMTRYFMAINC